MRSTVKFRFVSEGLPEETFHVLDFEGAEGLSAFFRFEITLASRRKGLDGGQLLKEPAELHISSPSGDVPFHGILTDFTQYQSHGDLFFYKATLAPRFWLLSLSRHNRIYLEENLQQFLSGAMQDGGLKAGSDFLFQLESSYDAREYVCQYNESHLAFVSRWLEHYGVYYYFDQQQQGAVVLTDSKTTHGPLPLSQTLRYAPDTSLEAPHASEVVTLFSIIQRPMPSQVMVQDWNYRTPDLDLKSRHTVDPTGRGNFNYYGDHFRTPSQGDTLAAIRSQELLCTQRTFHGASSIPWLCSGFTFTLENHFRSDCNAAYLLTRVQHKGSQREQVLGALGLEVDDAPITYSNSFEAIAEDVQFRPPRLAPWPRFSGVMHAHVDAAGSGEYAYVDDQGRYKVTLPFDRSGRKDGKASSWLRMAQPYGGSDHGFHFPLHKGTEVLLTCVDGDPDRPMILAAVPNPEKPSLVTAQSQTQARVTTSSGNKLHFSDTKGKEHILLHCPAHETMLVLGDQSDTPPTGGGSGNGGEG